MLKKLLISLCVPLLLTACVTVVKQPVNHKSPNFFTHNHIAKQHTANKQQWLTLHNNLRQQHQVANLVWSDKLAKSAEKFVNRCPSGHSGMGYGENIFFATASFPLENVMEKWYEEEKIYNYNHPRFSHHTGHFTQIVWKDTTEIGCAYKANCAGKWQHIWVCHYNPKGNIRLRFTKNVFPKTK